MNTSNAANNSKCCCASKANVAANLSMVFFEGTEDDLNRTCSDAEASQLLWAHLVPPEGEEDVLRPAVSAHEIEITRAYLDGNLNAQCGLNEPKSYSINSPQGTLTIKQEADEKHSSTTVSVKTVYNVPEQVGTPEPKYESCDQTL